MLCDTSLVNNLRKSLVDNNRGRYFIMMFFSTNPYWDVLNLNKFAYLAMLEYWLVVFYAKSNLEVFL